MDSVPESSSSEEDNQPNHSPVHSGLDMNIESESIQGEAPSRPPSPPPVTATPPPSLEITTPEVDLSAALGAKPTNTEIQGQELHEETVARWEFYLKKGVKKEERQNILEKYPISKNCQALTPLQTNDEVLDCMNESANKKDYFWKSLQHQMGHGLMAVGVVMDAMIKENQNSIHLPCLADAALLFSNVHNALSMLRKQNILPLLNAETRKVGLSSQLDKFLFGEKFGEAVKNKQNLKKTSEELKNKFTRYIRPGPAMRSTSSSKYPPPAMPSTSNNSSSRYLNYRRGERNTRMKTDKTSYRQKRGGNRDQFRRH